MSRNPRHTTFPSRPRRPSRALGVLAVLTLLVATDPAARAHIVPPQQLHPVASSYRRIEFLLNLNPIPWDSVHLDLAAIAAQLESFDEAGAVDLRTLGKETLAQVARVAAKDEDTMPAADKRRLIAHRVLSRTTRSVASAIRLDLETARANLADYSSASARFGAF